MNSEKHKIKAFTLGEMIIVILLTLIVVGLAFSVLQLVQKHMLAIKTNFETTTMINSLEQSLYIDASRSKRITFDSLEGKLQFLSETDTISYSFEKEFIVKENDTFKVVVADKFFFFEGKKHIDARIDAFKLITSKEFQSRTIFVSKQNDAELYMNP